METPETTEVTIYNATATRDGRYWKVSVQDLPDGRAAQAQGTTWTEAQHNAMDCVQSLFPEAPDTVGVRLIPADPRAAAAMTAVWDARGARVRAENAERDALATAVATLLDQGWSTRDAGKALGLSHQRISQLKPTGDA
ncbi:hypothetical protein BZB76_5007 [Actinomadura pelletieri DSM 43383]|uniref:Uncharacterized protein n=1 Tax=Actinomadura pelletieri DSM 43383 TaxID=1120940 RepID=A0A495QJ64_9ACTN|nr:hypothetical protein [Actinomadura pelletieri]RKS72187.1 hypothetical protein BZB76_5007 [Actinomadura pelletieri DSM 43383]